MTAVKLVVTFNEHVSSNQVASMASSLAAYGNVLPGSSDRESVVEVFRAAKGASLRERLAQVPPGGGGCGGLGGAIFGC